jgi:membrane-associated protein
VSGLFDLAVSSPLSYLAAFWLPCLDAILPLLPSETVVIGLGVATAGSTDPRIGLLVLLVACGAFAGDNLAYIIGRRFGPFADRRFFSGERGRRSRAWAERMLERFGGRLILVCRFIPGGRTAVTLTCGLVGYRRRNFVLATAFSAVIWASYAFWLGRLGGKAFESKPWVGFVLAFGIAVGISVLIEGGRRIYAIYRRRRSRRREPQVKRGLNYLQLRVHCSVGLRGHVEGRERLVEQQQPGLGAVLRGSDAANVFVTHDIAVGRFVLGEVTGRGDQGGATLYAQLAKILYTPGDASAKAQAEQAALAVKLWYSYGPAEVLRLYSDVVYFGHGFYGLQAASCGYYGVQPDQMSWPQAALLAGLVYQPTEDDPVANPAGALGREQHVLGRLVAVGTLSQAQVDAYLRIPVSSLLSPGRGCR